MANKSPLTLVQLRRAVESGKQAAVYLLVGPDAALRRRSAEILLRPHTDAGCDAAGSVTRLDAPEVGLEAILDEARSLPLFASADGAARVVWVRRFDDLVSPRKGTCKPLDPEVLKAYLQDPVLDTCLILEAADLDKRKAAYKALLAHAVVVDCSAPKKESDLRRWITALARTEGAEIDPDATVWLIEMVGPNITVLEQEMTKAVLFAGAGQPITTQVLEGLTGRSREHSIFDLTDALVRGAPVDAVRLLNQLLDDGEPPLKILPMIAWVTRQLLLAHDLGASGCPRQQALQGLGGRWNQRSALLERGSRAGRQRLARALNGCADADLFVKRMRDPRQGVDKRGPARGRLEALCRQICSA